jgi:hypothetical protein
VAAPVTLLLGTGKGAFLLEGARDRSDWAVRGPFCDGWPINHVLGDPATGTIWAAGGSDWSGAGVWRSTDGGASWQLSRLATGEFDEWLAADPDMAAQIGVAPSPPAPFTGQVAALWSLGRAGNTLLAGGKPGVLFASRDGGQSWGAVAGLNAHPTREGWEPGGAGLVLHAIVADPDAPERIWVGISAAGVFASEDGGASWDRRNRLGNAEPGSETGLCVHGLAGAAGARGRLYQQNHEGVFRSEDGGRSWQEITAGLPSGFGFPIVAHPQDPDTAWVFPLNGDMAGRFPPDAAAAVWRTRDGGTTWEPQREGLPGQDCFFTVLRQAMAVDRGTPPGVYFGTTSGSVFASRDEGAHWTEIARHLPGVLSVETLQRA